MNEYYIIPVGSLASPILENIVQDVNTVRKNNIGNKCVVKTFAGVVDHPSLNGFPKYTHAEILIEMAKAEWTTDPI